MSWKGSSTGPMRSCFWPSIRAQQMNSRPGSQDSYIEESALESRVTTFHRLDGASLRRLKDARPSLQKFHTFEKRRCTQRCRTTSGRRLSVNFITLGDL